ATLNALRAGEALLQIDPACRGLIRALRGGWHYATKLVGGVKSDTPMKPNHPHEDYGDALCYLLNGVAPLSEARPARLPYHAKTAFNPLSYGRPRVWPLGTGTSPRGWGRSPDHALTADGDSGQGHGGPRDPR